MVLKSESKTVDMMRVENVLDGCIEVNTGETDRTRYLIIG